MWAEVSSDPFEAQLFGDSRLVGVARGEGDRFFLGLSERGYCDGML